MKRILALVLMLCLLAGCAGRTETSQPPSAEDSPAPAEVSEPAAQPNVLEDVALEGAEGFYVLSDLPGMAEYSVTDAVMPDPDHVCFLTGSLGEHLMQLDLTSGQVTPLADIPIPDGVNWESTSLLCADPVAINQSSFSNEEIYILQQDGSLLPLQAPEDRTIASWEAHFNQTDCIWFENSSARLYASPLSGEESRLICQIDQTYFFPSLYGLTADGKSAIFTAICGKDDAVCLTVALDSGEITGVYADTEDMSAKIALQGLVSHQCITNEEMINYHLTAQDPTRRVETDFDLHLLAPQSGELQGEDWWLDNGGVQSSWGRRLVFSNHYGDGNRLLLWDYSDLTPETVVLDDPEVYVPPVPMDDETVAKRVAALEEAYGVSIHYGADMNALYPDYTLTPCEDLDATGEALDVMERAFALYPEDYFRQLGGDSIRGFSFYLCGRMDPIDPSVSINAPGGLSYTVDGVELIAFDITGVVRVQDVVHELTHALDHWLWEDDLLDESKWSAYNPEGFSYYYAYVNPEGESYEWSGDTKYTAWDDAYYGGDVESVYFVDPYSTTYPTEDRARLMENLLAEPDHLPDYFQSTHVQQKLNYYFQCIREKFDTTNWPQQTSWEQALAAAG